MKIFKTGLGTNKVTTLTGDAAAGPLLDKLKLSGSLKSLLDEYVFFTYAPLLLYSDINFNPVQEWLNLHNKQNCVFILPLPAPVFQLGATKTRLDNILWACEKAHWPSLAMHIGTIGLVDRDNNLFTRTICQGIPILDVAAVEKNIGISKTPPTISIYAFAVDANNRCVSFMPAKDLFVEKPYLISLPPMSDTVRMANALFNNVDPYAQG